MLIASQIKTYYPTLKWIPLSRRSRGLSAEFARSLEYLSHITVHSQLSLPLSQGDGNAQLIVAEDLRHVLVQPIDLIARRKDKVLHLLVAEAVEILLFL